MDKNLMVSVSIVTYNHRNYISQCLDSVLMQETTFPFEIILGEDESNDGTREICIEYAKKFPDKIRLFLRSRRDVIYINGNPTGRYNFIENLKACTGKYLALCEGDDYWTDPLKLEKQVGFLETNKEYSMCFHEAEIVNEKSEFMSLFNNSTEPKTYDLIDFTKKNFVSTASVLFRNRITIPELFIKLPAVDWALHMLNAERGEIYYMPDCMSAYRKHEKGLWSKLSHEEMILNGVEVMKELDRYFDYKYHDNFQCGIEKRLLRLVKKKESQNIKKKIVKKLKHILYKINKF